MSETFRFGVLLYPDVMALDVFGPADVFAMVPNAEVHLLWKNLEPVCCTAGWRIKPTMTFADCPPLDVLCVPGGGGQVPLMQDEETLEFLRRRAPQARYVTAVCTGSLLLGAAGLLRGYRATCHWMSRDQLALLGATPVVDRIVRDRNRMTGAGVIAGVDLALAVVAELYGVDVAKSTQLNLEYNPRPPFRTGSPELASRALVARTMQSAAECQARRLAATKSAAARLA